jgi:hypothetical protein
VDKHNPDAFISYDSYAVEGFENFT